MTKFNPSLPDIDLLAKRINELREELFRLSPLDVAENTSAEYLGDEKMLTLQFWDSELRISFHDYQVMDSSGKLLPSFLQTFALYYLYIADGSPLTGKWVSFAELPGGRMYDRAFQRYTGDELVEKFGLDLDGYKKACIAAGGAHTETGGEAYLFWAFPRVPILVNFWVGDEEFSSSCKLLFDASVSHYLPTDALAILGGNLTKKIIKLSQLTR